MELFGCERKESASRVPDADAALRATGAAVDATPEPVRHWEPPPQPAEVGPGTPRIAVLTAPWCQWCMVLEHDVLPDPRVERTLARTFRIAEVNVDANPAWMELPDIAGLPTLAFFDEEGRHVLTKSGYRPAADLVVLLRAVHRKIEQGDIEPYPRRPRSVLGEEGLTPQAAAAALNKFESRLFIAVNSNGGGFGSTSRHPRPKLLLELERWKRSGDAPERVGEWIELTVEGAMRGGSPNLRGEPLPDMDFDDAELRRLSREGADAGPRWKHGVETLPTKDPYLGLRDPVDGGFFRYAAGPGWYNPHFERLAGENLAWILLLRERGNADAAQKTWKWLVETFDSGEWLDSGQASDPFYYRLPAKERTVPPPPVDENRELAVQAFAARVDPARCVRLLEALDTPRWPRARMSDDDAPAALPDAVGESLVAISECPDGDAVARELADAAVRRWESGFGSSARLHRLAAGICAADHPRCPDALAAAVAIDLDTEFAPPLLALQRRAKSRR